MSVIACSASLWELRKLVTTSSTRICLPSRRLPARPKYIRPMSKYIDISPVNTTELSSCRAMVAVTTKMNRTAKKIVPTLVQISSILDIILCAMLANLDTNLAPSNQQCTWGHVGQLAKSRYLVIAAE